MTALINKRTAIVVSPLDSAMARFQCSEMLKSGTNLVGLVGNGVREDLDAAVATFSDFATATAQARVDAAIILDDPLVVRERVNSALEAGIKLIVVLTEFVPVHDALEMRRKAAAHEATLVGPNSSGILSPTQSKAGYFSEHICIAGDVGIITKGGSIAYGVLTEMRSSGLGVSTIVSVGPDLVKGMDYAALLPHFERDPRTRCILLLGEIGGLDEEAAAEVIAREITKPVIAYVCGKYIIAGQSVGHAGAIVQAGVGDHASKVDALRNAGVKVADDFESVVPLLRDLAVGSASAATAGVMTDAEVRHEV